MLLGITENLDHDQHSTHFYRRAQCQRTGTTKHPQRGGLWTIKIALLDRAITTKHLVIGGKCQWPMAGQTLRPEPASHRNLLRGRGLSKWPGEIELKLDSPGPQSNSVEHFNGSGVRKKFFDTSTKFSAGKLGEGRNAILCDHIGRMAARPSPIPKGKLNGEEETKWLSFSRFWRS